MGPDYWAWEASSAGVGRDREPEKVGGRRGEKEEPKEETEVE